MSQWTHPICDDCWDELNPDRPAARTRPDYAERDRCCWCGGDTESGIYLREDPATLTLHEPHGW